MTLFYFVPLLLLSCVILWFFRRQWPSFLGQLIFAQKAIRLNHFLKKSQPQSEKPPTFDNPQISK